MRIISLIICLLIHFCALSQEFKVSISVAAPQIQGSDKEIYNTIQTALNSFINDRVWTNYHYQEFEKIEGSISINVKTRSSQEDFSGDLYIQLRRPVYGSTYTTTMLNTQEKDFAFKFLEGMNIDFDENNYTNNLLSTIAFYLNYFLALDGDSFAPNGGYKYFQTCNNIVTAAQRSSDDSWKRAGKSMSASNKYWMIENYTNSTYSAMHSVLYRYHRLGLDALAGDNPSEARNNIVLALKDLKQVNSEKMGLVCVTQFIEAKSDEIVAIFKGAPANEQTDVIEVMKQINPTQTAKYEQINQSSMQNTIP